MPPGSCATPDQMKSSLRLSLTILAAALTGLALTQDARTRSLEQQAGIGSLVKWAANYTEAASPNADPIFWRSMGCHICYRAKLGPACVVPMACDASQVDPDKLPGSP